MYHYSAQELRQADTLGHPNSTRRVRVHPWPASPPMWNEGVIQTFETTYPMFSDDVDLVTDSNTLMNCYIPPPAWATVDDDYHERRGVQPDRGFAIPSSDAMWGQRTTMTRSPRSITSAGTPQSSRGDYSRYQYQVPHYVRSEFEDDSEDDETRGPANTVASYLSSATYVHPYHQEGHSRPWSNRQAPATAAASGPSPRPLRGIKRVLHKLLSKFRRKRPSGRLPPPTPYLLTAPIPVATMGAITVIPAPWNTYDGVQYCVHDQLNTGASILERSHTIQMHVAQHQPHPLTMATHQTAARFQSAVQTGGSEVDLLRTAMSRTRQLQDWQDGYIMDLMELEWTT